MDNAALSDEIVRLRDRLEKQRVANIINEDYRENIKRDCNKVAVENKDLNVRAGKLRNQMKSIQTAVKSQEEVFTKVMQTAVDDPDDTLVRDSLVGFRTSDELNEGTKASIGNKRKQSNAYSGGSAQKTTKIGRDMASSV